MTFSCVVIETHVNIQPVLINLMKISWQSETDQKYTTKLQNIPLFFNIQPLLGQAVKEASFSRPASYQVALVYDLVPKGEQMGGSDFWLSIKSVSNTLSCCCFVCAFITGQYHSGNNISFKSGAAGEILFFESEKRHEIQPLKKGHAHDECFQCFHSCTWWIKTLPQSPICTKEISLYTVHIKLIITKFCFWS